MKKDYDEIRIEDLEVFANHGVFPEENVLGQKFLVSAVLYTDTRRAGLTDDLKRFYSLWGSERFYRPLLAGAYISIIGEGGRSACRRTFAAYSRTREDQTGVKKPWAPVRLPLKTVSVVIERQWHTAYIALGSNMGDREKYITDAVEALGALKGCVVEKCSSFIETPPYGVTDQDDFLNGCLKLRTLFYPKELLRELNRIEMEAGRERIVHWGPRTLDLDIILYDDLVYEGDELCIPHVEMHKERFCAAASF